MAYRVLIADDEEIIRQGIEFLVDWERLDCSIVERCANGQEVIRFLEQSPSESLLKQMLWEQLLY